MQTTAEAVDIGGCIPDPPPNRLVSIPVPPWGVGAMDGALDILLSNPVDGGPTFVEAIRTMALQDRAASDLDRYQAAGQLAAMARCRSTCSMHLPPDVRVIDRANVAIGDLCDWLAKCPSPAVIRSLAIRAAYTVGYDQGPEHVPPELRSYAEAGHAQRLSDDADQDADLLAIAPAKPRPEPIAFDAERFEDAIDAISNGALELSDVAMRPPLHGDMKARYRAGLERGEEATTCIYEIQTNGYRVHFTVLANRLPEGAAQ